jgi:hypothetical protein
MRLAARPVGAHSRSLTPLAWIVGAIRMILPRWALWTGDLDSLAEDEDARLPQTFSDALRDLSPLPPGLTARLAQRMAHCPRLTRTEAQISTGDNTQTSGHYMGHGSAAWWLSSPAGLAAESPSLVSELAAMKANVTRLELKCTSLRPARKGLRPARHKTMMYVFGGRPPAPVAVRLRGRRRIFRAGSLPPTARASPAPQPSSRGNLKPGTSWPAPIPKLVAPVPRFAGNFGGGALWPAVHTPFKKQDYPQHSRAPHHSGIFSSAAARC